MRGIPGSGKSTLAKKLKSSFKDGDAIICSADDFRYNRAGKYIFKPDQLWRTHLKCQQRAAESCKKNAHVVIVDNTNIQPSDFKPYLLTALEYSYCVVFLKMKAGDIDTRVMLNTHGVPRESIEKMKGNFKDNPTPYYFKWAIPYREGKRLENVMKKLLQKCTDADAKFQEFLTKKIETDIKSLFSTYHMGNASSNQYHVTTAYTNPSLIERIISDVYTKSPLVQRLIGLPGFLNVVGLIVTPKCITARVLLDEQQRKIWGRNDSINKGEINPIALESSSVSIDEALSRLCLQGQISSLDCQLPEGGIKPHHGTGCTAHITLGTRGNNRPVVAKETLYQIVQLEAYASPTSQSVTSCNLTVRSFGPDIWVVYFKQPFTVQALFCGHYNPVKDS